MKSLKYCFFKDIYYYVLSRLDRRYFLLQTLNTPYTFNEFVIKQPNDFLHIIFSWGHGQKHFINLRTHILDHKIQAINIIYSSIEIQILQ